MRHDCAEFGFPYASLSLVAISCLFRSSGLLCLIFLILSRFAFSRRRPQNQPPPHPPPPFSSMSVLHPPNSHSLAPFFLRFLFWSNGFGVLHITEFSWMFLFFAVLQFLHSRRWFTIARPYVCVCVCVCVCARAPACVRAKNRPR